MRQIVGVPRDALVLSAFVGVLVEALEEGDTVLLVPEEGRIPFHEAADILGCALIHLEVLVAREEIHPVTWNPKSPLRGTFLGKDILAYRAKRQAHTEQAGNGLMHRLAQGEHTVVGDITQGSMGEAGALEVHQTCPLCKGVFTTGDTCRLAGKAVCGACYHHAYA